MHLMHCYNIAFGPTDRRMDGREERTGPGLMWPFISRPLPTGRTYLPTYLPLPSIPPSSYSKMRRRAECDWNRSLVVNVPEVAII